MNHDPKHCYFPAYQSVVFWADGWTPPAKSFAILSACSPTGEQWPAARNQVADEKLRRRLRESAPRRITGQSPDGSHAEPSWASACSRAVAVELGREFRQDAIFWVEGDSLAVVDCKASRPDLLLGSFNARLNRTDVARGEAWPRVVVSNCDRWILESGLQLTRSSTLFVVEYTESIHHGWSRIYSLASDDRGLIWALEEGELPNFDEEGDAAAAQPSSRFLACMVTDGNEVDIATELWRISKPGNDASKDFKHETPLGNELVERLWAGVRLRSRGARIYLHPMRSRPSPSRE
jgi:hypothetical protein